MKREATRHEVGEVLEAMLRKGLTATLLISADPLCEGCTLESGDQIGIPVRLVEVAGTSDVGTVPVSPASLGIRMELVSSGTPHLFRGNHP